MLLFSQHHLGEQRLLDQLGDVDSRVVFEVVAHELLEIFLAELGADAVQLVGRADAAVQHELHIDDAETVQVVQVEQVEQN